MMSVCMYLGRLHPQYVGLFKDDIGTQYHLMTQIRRHMRASRVEFIIHFSSNTLAS